jgi:hypothetical protein
MKTYLKRIVAGLATRCTGGSKARPRPEARPALEGLEDRCCPTTVRAFATALANQLNADVNRLLGDAARAEQQSPTLCGRAITQDLVRLAKDAHAGALVPALKDINTLGHDMVVEDAVVRVFHLPSKWSLGSNRQVVTDLGHAIYDEVVTVALAKYVASHPGVAVINPQPAQTSIPQAIMGGTDTTMQQWLNAAGVGGYSTQSPLVSLLVGPTLGSGYFAANGTAPAGPHGLNVAGNTINWNAIGITGTDN